MFELFKMFKMYKSIEIVSFFYFFLISFENENVLSMKILFFSIMKDKSIVTISKFLIVFRIRILLIVHFDDQNRYNSNFSKKKADRMQSKKKSKFDEKKCCLQISLIL